MSFLLSAISQMWPLPTDLLGIITAQVVPAMIAERRLRAGEPDHAAVGGALILNGNGLISPAVIGEGQHSAVDAYHCSIDDLAFFVSTDDVEVRDLVHGRDLGSFSLVQVASYPRPTGSLLSALNAHLRACGRPLIAAPVEVPSKLCQFVKYAHAGLPVAPTAYLSAKHLGDSYQEIAETLGEPFVLRSLTSGDSRNDRLVRSERDFAELLGPTGRPFRMFFAQQYIPRNGRFQLLLLGGEVSVIVHRCPTGAPEYSGGLEADHITQFDVEEFDPAIKALAVRSAALLECDIVVVNLVQDRTEGSWYLLEANLSPDLRSGPFADAGARAYSRYLERRIAAASRRR